MFSPLKTVPRFPRSFSISLFVNRKSNLHSQHLFSPFLCRFTLVLCLLSLFFIHFLSRTLQSLDEKKDRKKGGGTWGNQRIQAVIKAVLVDPSGIEIASPEHGPCLLCGTKSSGSWSHRGNARMDGRGRRLFGQGGRRG